MSNKPFIQKKDKRKKNIYIFYNIKNKVLNDNLLKTKKKIDINNVLNTVN